MGLRKNNGAIDPSHDPRPARPRCRKANGARVASPRSRELTVSSTADDNALRMSVLETYRDFYEYEADVYRITPEAERVMRSVKSRRTAWLATRLRGLSDAELAAVDAAVVPLQELIDE